MKDIYLSCSCRTEGIQLTKYDDGIDIIFLKGSNQSLFSRVINWFKYLYKGELNYIHLEDIEIKKLLDFLNEEKEIITG
jgi:hypothetical protein